MALLLCWLQLVLLREAKLTVSLVPLDEEAVLGLGMGRAAVAAVRARLTASLLLRLGWLLHDELGVVQVVLRIGTVATLVNH